MKLNKFNRLPRLLSEVQDESGTDVAEVASEDQDEPEQAIEVVADAGDEQSAEATGQQESAESDADELIVTIGDSQPEEDEKSAPSWVKELRRKNREDQRRIRELEEKLNAAQGGATVNDPPKKPKLEDFDYDADEFEKAMDAYYSQKADHDRKAEEQRKAQEEREKEWSERLKTYAEGKTKYPAERMKEAEEEVTGTLNQARQAMLLDLADDPTTLVYALGTNGETLRKLAAIKSDARFIKEVAKIEMNIKVQPKAKTPPPPERTLSGSGRTPGSTAANLEALKAEAQRTGDYSKYLAEKRRLGK